VATKKELLLKRKALLEKKKALLSNQKQQEIVKGVAGDVPKEAFESGERNILGNIVDRPAAAVRGGIQAMAPGGQTPMQGFQQGSINPTSVPTFQEQALEKFAPKTESTALNFAGGLPASAGGLAADIATNPASLLMMLLGNTATNAVGKTGPGQAVGRFMNKPRSLKNLFRFDNALKQAQKSQVALEEVRNTLGGAVKLKISEVENVPTKFDFKNIPDKVNSAINKTKVYDVNISKVKIQQPGTILNPSGKLATPGSILDEGGKIKQTVGNLNKIKEATGDLLTPKNWIEAPKKEMRQIKQFYGAINKAMKDASRKSGVDISKPLDSYNKFMGHYRNVQHTIQNTAEVAMGNKLKTAFKLFSEKAYKDSWKEVAKLSPEIKAVMGSMNRRELLKNLLKVAAAGGLYRKGAGVLRKAGGGDTGAISDAGG